MGCTFKPGTDDLREAPSLVNVPLLLEDGAHVRMWDPVGQPNFKKKFPKKVHYCEKIEEALQGADLCLILTEWDEVKDLDVKMYEKLMRTPIILDGRNCYELKQFVDSRVIYDSIGRKTVNLELIRDIKKENKKGRH